MCSKIKKRKTSTSSLGFLPIKNGPGLASSEGLKLASPGPFFSVLRSDLAVVSALDNALAAAHVQDCVDVGVDVFHARIESKVHALVLAHVG